MDNTNDLGDSESKNDFKFSNYEEYVQVSLDSGCNNYLSESEYNEFINKGPSLKFAPMPTLMNLGGGAINGILRRSDEISRAATMGPVPLAQTASKIIAEEGLNAAKGFIINEGIKFGKFTGNNNKSGGNNNTIYDNGINVTDSNRLLGQFQTQPLKLELKPGILNRSYGDLTNEPDSRNTYLNLTGAALTMPSDPSASFFFSNVLIPWIANKAQASVNFRVDLTLLDENNLKTYFNAVLKALNVYYFNTSVISYCNVPTNRDMGMRSLRSMISAQDIDYITQLNGLIRSIAIPTNINSAAFFFNQNFSDGLNGDGLYKFMPISFNTSTDTTNGEVTGFNGNSSSIIIQAITDLNTSTVRQTSALLSRIAPNWVNPIVYDASPIAIFSKTASTIFANASHRYWYSGQHYYGPGYNTLDDKLSYISYDSTLDGIALACFSPVHIGFENNTTPSLFKVINSQMINGTFSWYTNRFSYVYSTSLSRFAWFPSNLRIESCFSRNERSRALTNTEYYGRLADTIKMSGVTPNVCNESAKDFLSWLMSIDTIPSKKVTDTKYSSRRSTTKDKVDSK